MSVVFLRTPGKMIRKISVLAVFLGLSWLDVVCGAAYSNVYFQSGPDIVPVDYVNYGAPPVVANPQIAQLTAAPVGSVLPLPNYVSPCVAPCFIPSQTIGTVAAAPSAKLVTYNPPRAPAVVVPANDDKSSYEYSYIVYDENTGDRKAQRELSDGSVVQGEYSFIQPDGYVREVKYTADDLTGFNAVVKNFLPESVLITDKKPETKSKSSPCPDKSEALKVEPKQNTIEPVKAEIIPKFANLEENAPRVEITVIPVAKTKPDCTDTTDSVATSTYDLATDTTQYSTEASPEIIKVLTTESDINEIETTRTHEALQATAPAPEATKPQLTVSNGLISYNDIIKCVQAAIANRDTNADKPTISPLTYILLPSANRLC